VTSPSKAELEEHAIQMERESKEAARRADIIMQRDPRLPWISAYIMARDLMGADRSLEWLREGKHEWRMAEAFCGSYGRLDLRVRAYHEGLLTPEQALEGLADAWSGSDPDDTDERFFGLWLEAFITNGHKYLRDHVGKGLPRRRLLTIYRGQDEDAPFGLSWSLDARVAEKFANGAATRQHHRGGVVYEAMVKRTDVMGYMTGRNEAEVIVHPDDLIVPHVLR
jgi:hypothetical protein